MREPGFTQHIFDRPHSLTWGLQPAGNSADDLSQQYSGAENRYLIIYNFGQPLFRFDMVGVSFHEKGYPTAGVDDEHAVLQFPPLFPHCIHG